MSGDTQSAPVPGRPFVTSPLPEAPAPRSMAFYGRLVVAVVIASVAIVTVTAWAISESVATRAVVVPVREAFIGSWGFLVSDQRPPGQLLLIAGAGICLIALVALSLEATSAILT